MRFVLNVMVLLAVLMIPSLAPAAPEDASSLAARFGGTWNGTYAGDGYGTLVLTLTPSAEGKHTGSLRATGDGGGYTAEFTTLTLEAGKMTATFDIPGGGGGVSMEGAFDGDTVTGTWSHHNPNGGTASGTWKASRESAQPK